jgi:hypothetical protein
MGIEPTISGLEVPRDIQFRHRAKATREQLRNDIFLPQPRIELGFSAHKTDTLTVCVIGADWGLPQYIHYGSL